MHAFYINIASHPHSKRTHKRHFAIPRGHKMASFRSFVHGARRGRRPRHSSTGPVVQRFSTPQLDRHTEYVVLNWQTSFRRLYRYYYPPRGYIVMRRPSWPWKLQFRGGHEARQNGQVGAGIKDLFKKVAPRNSQGIPKQNTSPVILTRHRPQKKPF